ncbi:MAG: MFS transporter [Firmicutes bacterium]|nr:MFS transporter [Bacillota bacterium]
MPRGRRVLFYLATMLYWFSLYTYVPTLTPYVLRLGGTLAFAGIVVASYGFAQLLVRIPIGILSDRLHNRKAFILGGISCGIVSCLGFALTRDAGLALLWRGIAGIAAGSWVAFTVLYASSWPSADAPKAMGLISFYTSAAQMAAAALGGISASWFGWHAPFWLGALGGTLGLVFAATTVRESPDTVSSPPTVRGLLTLGRQWPLLSVSLLAVLAQSVTFTTLFGFTPLYADHLGAHPATLGLLTLVSTIPNAIAGYLCGSFLGRLINVRIIAALGFFIACAGTLAIPFTHSLPALFATQAFNGFGQGLSMPILMGLAIAGVAAHQRATAMGFFQAIYSVGMVGGPLLTSFLGLQTGFVTMGCTSLAAGILALVWIRPTNAPTPVAPGTDAATAAQS